MFSFLLSLSVGIGAIDETNYSRDNPVGIIEIAQPINDDLSVKYFHASSIQQVEDDYGVNILYLKLKIK